MDKELIKSELITEVEKMFNKKEFQSREAEGFDKLRAFAEHGLTIEKLNSILDKHNIEFQSESDKDEFINYIQPTMLELTRKFIMN